jgi:hypothetical protein
MRRLGAICLVLALAAPALAADPPAEESTSIPWYRWLFLGERSKPAPEKPPTAAVRDKPPAAATPSISSREAATKMIADEQKIYLERLKAITQIKRIALEQGDEAMIRKAEELEAKAEEVYKLRMAKLPNPEDLKDDRAALERGRDTRPATAQRRPSAGGTDR